MLTRVPFRLACEALIVEGDAEVYPARDGKPDTFLVLVYEPGAGVLRSSLRLTLRPGTTLAYLSSLAQPKPWDGYSPVDPEAGR